ALLGHAGGLACLEEDDSTRVLEERRHVGRDEILARAEADDHPAGARDPRGDDLPGILRRDERERGGALELREHRERGLVERAAPRELVLEKMHRDLGVRLARELVSLRD